MPARGGSEDVATTRRVCEGKTHVTHLLRRSIRKGNTANHKTLRNLSHLPEHLVDNIKRSLKGETFVPAGEAFRITHSRLERDADNQTYTGRWNIETTFQEVRSYLRLETTRGWSRNTVLRVGPCLFGLYTVVAYLYAELPLQYARVRVVD